MCYLERSFSVGLLPAQIQLPQDGQAHKEPVAEAVVVDQLEDVFHAEVDQRHDALQRRAADTHSHIAAFHEYTLLTNTGLEE